MRKVAFLILFIGDVVLFQYGILMAIFFNIAALAVFYAIDSYRDLKKLEKEKKDWIDFQEEEKKERENNKKQIYNKYVKPFEDKAKILDLNWPCDANALHKAWKIKAKIAHPDTGGSIKKMQEVNEAYSFLKPYAS